MRKLFFVTILSGLLILSAVGCGGGSVNTETAGNNNSGQVVEEEGQQDVNDEQELLPLEIKEFAYTVGNGYLDYAVVLHNPNKDLAIQFPSIRITAKDEDGVLLGTEDEVFSIIYPEQDFVMASLGFEVDEEPAAVEAEPLEPDEYNILPVSSLEHPLYEPLTVTNTSYRSDKIVGEIQNNNDYDIDSGVVTVIVRDEDGKLVKGTETYVDSIKANASTPFEISLPEDFATDNYEVYANNW